MKDDFTKLTFFLLFILVGCASPGVSRKYDEFEGGDLIKLENNQLDTPGFGDIYFNVQGVRKKDGQVKLEVIGAVDYEWDSLSPLYLIDKTKDLALIVDNENIYLRPVPDSLTHGHLPGVLKPLNVVKLKYMADLAELKKIVAGQVVKMKIYLTNHKNGGFAGKFTPENFNKLKNFLANVESSTSVGELERSGDEQGIYGL